MYRKQFKKKAISHLLVVHLVEQIGVIFNISGAFIIIDDLYEEHVIE